MKYILVVVLIMVSMLSCTNKNEVSKNNSQTNILSADWKSNFDHAMSIVIDVRNHKELELNPAKASVHIPLSKLESKLTQLDQSKKILVFCESGGRAGKAMEILKASGFQNVTNIGSWRDWNQFYETKKH